MASYLLPNPQLISWSGDAACFPRRKVSICFSPPAVKRPSTSFSQFATGPAPPKVSPWLMLPPSVEGGDTAYNFYDLTKKKLVDNSFNGPGSAPNKAFNSDTEVVGSSHEFLVFFNKSRHELFLYNPISSQFIDLPPIHTLSLNNIELGSMIRKVIISDDETRALMIFGPADRLAFCCPGSSTEWTPLDPLSGRAYNDIVYSKRDKVFTCYINNNSIEEWDLRPSKAVNLVCQLKFKEYLPSWYGIKDQIEDSHRFKFKKYIPWWYGIKDLIESRYCNNETYVVFAEHSNQLYVVYRYIMERSPYVENTKNVSKYGFPVREWDDSYPHKTIGFSVCKVRRVGDNTLQLNYMEGSLDNLVMFLGRNHSFALRAQDYPELKPNSIYFTDNLRHTTIDWQTYGAHDTGVYYFNDRTFYPIFDCPNYNVSSMKGIVSLPIWFTPSRY